MRILQCEDEKHPTFLDNRLLEGIELAFVYQCKAIGHACPTIESLAAAGIFCFLILLYFDMEMYMGISIFFFCENVSEDPLSSSLDSSDFEGKSSVPLSSNGNNESTSIFTSLYVSCLQSNRKRRNDCILGVLKRCLQLLAYLHESNIAASANLLNHNENELKLPTPKTTPRSSDGNGSAAAVGSVGSDDITPMLPVNGSGAPISEIRSAPTAISMLLQILISYDILSNSDMINHNNSAGVVREAGILLSLVEFLCSIISVLPFEFVEEPLQGIYWISRNAPFAVSAVLSHAKLALPITGTW